MDRYLEISLVLWMSFIHKNDRHKISWTTPNKILPLGWTGDGTKVGFTKVYTKVGFKPW
jgi:hypothetical protein